MVGAAFDGGVALLLLEFELSLEAALLFERGLFFVFFLFGRRFLWCDGMVNQCYNERCNKNSLLLVNAVAHCYQCSNQLMDCWLVMASSKIQTSSLFFIFFESARHFPFALFCFD